MEEAVVRLEHGLGVARYRLAAPRLGVFHDLRHRSQRAQKSKREREGWEIGLGVGRVGGMGCRGSDSVVVEGMHVV